LSTVSSAVLELREVAVAAQQTALLQGVSLSVAPGEIVAITGPSGCGKTTLLRAICGLDDPEAGEILLRGQLAGAVGWTLFRRSVLLMEQKPVVLDASVRENLRRPFSYRVAKTVGQVFLEARSLALLEALGVGRERMEQNARSLSVGQQQRVCLIRALLLEPAVLLLDEPTSALDTASTEGVEEVLRSEARERGLAVLVVTHSERQAQEWCDRCFDLSPFRVGVGKGLG